MKILSIDAWKTPDGWTWNNWHKVGEIDKEKFESLVTTRQILAWMREEGYLSDHSKGRVSINDDQYNLVIVGKNTLEPLFAIEYGPEY
jgi:hypothetical protein